METPIDEIVFFRQVLPCISAVDPRTCTFKRVVPFKPKGSKEEAIGLFESELNKHVFFVLVDSVNKRKIHSLYQGVYYIPPGLDRASLTSDQKGKYQIPTPMWELKADINTLRTWVEGAGNQLVMELEPDIPVYKPVEEKPPVKDEEEYNKVNPDHYKGEGIESIDVINAFFNGSFNLGNAFKYMVRCGKKPGTPPEDDLKKTIWYLFNELKTQISKEDLELFVNEEIKPKHFI